MNGYRADGGQQKPGTPRGRQEERRGARNTPNEIAMPIPGMTFSGGEGIPGPWAFLPTMMAAVTASMQAAGTSGRREEKEDEEAKELIADLREDVRRLRRQRNEEEAKAKRAEDGYNEMKTKLESQEKVVEYLEYKIEYLRRQLSTKQRERSPYRETDKHVNVPLGHLLDVITKTELAFHEIETSTSPSTPKGDKQGPTPSKAKDETHEKEKEVRVERMEVDGEEKTSTPPHTQPSRTLAERLQRTPKPLGARLGPGKRPTFNVDIPVSATAMRKAMVPMVDADGNRLIPRGPMGGFMMVRGKGVDLSRPLPYVRPSKKKINPTTGEPWTGEELYWYPLGIPGWSSDLAISDIQETVVKCRLNYHRLRELDQSLEAVTIPQIVTRVVPGTPPWRFPATVAEVTHLRDVAMEPCNLLALAFWEQFVRECNVVDGEKRTEAQWHGAGLGFHRPLWAPFVPNSDIQPLQRLTQGVPPSTDDAAHPAPGLATQDTPMASTEDATVDVDNATTTPLPTTRTLLAGSQYLEEWAAYLKENPGISVPGVERDTNGCIANLSPLRGMLKVATLGCDGPDGRLTLLFVGRVAQFVREHNLVILPSQLMRVSPIKAESDMTVSHIRDHFKPVLNHGMDFSVEDEPLYDEDMQGVADWLLAVDPPGDAASMGDPDEDGWGLSM